MATPNPERLVPAPAGQDAATTENPAAADDTATGSRDGSAPPSAPSPNQAEIGSPAVPGGDTSPRATGPAATGPATTAEPRGSAPGAATNPLTRYPRANPDAPTWPSWLLLLGLGAAAPFLIRAAVRRDETRYFRPSQEVRLPAPVAAPASATLLPEESDSDPAQPAPAQPAPRGTAPARPATGPPPSALRRTPVAAQRRTD